MAFFQRGYSMVLVKNLKIFHLFYYWQNQPAKYVWQYSRKKKSVFRLKNQKVKKSQRIGIFPKGIVHGSMALIKNLKFFHLFFLAKINEKGKWVWQYPRKKKAFLNYKKQKVKKSKNWHFSKGVTPWFWSKIWKFSIFLLLAKSPSKMCLMIF